MESALSMAWKCRIKQQEITTFVLKASIVKASTGMPTSIGQDSMDAVNAASPGATPRITWTSTMGTAP